jgi:hypothetical protein
MTDIDQVALQTLLQEAMLLNEVEKKHSGEEAQRLARYIRRM